MGIPLPYHPAMWRLKVLIQFVLAHAPFGEAINHRLQRVNAIRRGGKEFIRDRVAEVADGLETLQKIKPIAGLEVVEIGTGWDALPTLMLYQRGATKIHTFDHLPHLRLDMAKKVVDILREDRDSNERMARLSLAETLPDMLSRAGIIYHAPGDATKTGLPDKSIDLYYSFAVLEHVPEVTAARVVEEARRVLKPDGIYYALIGLHDHYNGFDRRVSKVNFLKYPEWLWAFLVKNKISYHNRLRERDFLHMLKLYGAEIIHLNSITDPGDLDRVKAMKVNKMFASYTPEELAVTRTEIIARFPSLSRP